MFSKTKSFFSRAKSVFSNARSFVSDAYRGVRKGFSKVFSLGGNQSANASSASSSAQPLNYTPDTSARNFSPWTPPNPTQNSSPKTPQKPTSFSSGSGGSASRSPSASNYSQASYSPSGGSSFIQPQASKTTSISAGSIGSGTQTYSAPSSPGTGNMQGVVNGINFASGTDVNTGVNPQTGEVAQPAAAAGVQQKTATEKFEEEMMKLQNQERSPDMAGAFNRAQEQSGKLQAQQQMNNTQGQINGITAGMNTDLLNYRAAVAREGGTMGGFGGIEAEVTREATIKLLPLQAQLANDRGNFQAASEHMDTLFNIYSKEAQNSADVWNRGIATYQGLLTTKEKNRLAEITARKQSDVDSWKAMGAEQNGYIKEFLKAGDRAAVAAMSSIRPLNNVNASPAEKALSLANYQRDVSNVLSQYGGSLSKAGGSEAPIVKSINGVDMQWNKSTNNWETIGGNSPGSLDLKQKSLDQISLLRDTAKKALDTEIVKASGRSGLRKFLEQQLVGSTDYTQLVSLTNTLKVNVLSLMTDPTIKKFFGPQMSNADVLLMTSAGTTLNPELNSPKQMRDELNRLDQLFNRMQTTVRIGESGANIITAPNGELIQITD